MPGGLSRYRGAKIRAWSGGLTTFRNQLRWLHLAWNRYYLDLLDGYEVQLDTLIGEIETYLGRHGAGS